MRLKPKHPAIGAIVLLAMVGGLSSGVATSAEGDKPNIVFIMGDDIGMWNIGAYHRGLMAGRTPNIDELAAQGAISSLTLIPEIFLWRQENMRDISKFVFFSALAPS